MIHPVSLIPVDQYPCQVWADSNSNLIASAIKARTKANYSHVMWMVRPGVLVTQGFTGYREIQIGDYMKPSNRLKFIGLNGITNEGRKAIYESIYKKLDGPWYRKGYDFLGIIGQLTGIKWIQNPWKDFCSEDVPFHLKRALKNAPSEFSPELADAINGIAPEQSPGSYDAYSKLHRDVFPLIAKWEADD